jgi:hypothetical protein
LNLLWLDVGLRGRLFGRGIGFAVILKGHIEAAADEGHNASTLEVMTKDTRVNGGEVRVVESKTGNREVAIIEAIVEAVVEPIVRESHVGKPRLGGGWVNPRGRAR